MTVLLRKLKNKRYWDDESWLGSDTPADVLNNFHTSKNELSIFVLEEQDVQIERVVAALAITRDSLNSLDLALVPIDVLQECKIETNAIQGETPDQVVNAWHQNLIQLTVSKIVQLMSCIKSDGKLCRYQVNDVAQAIKNSLDNEAFNVKSIKKPSLVDALKRRNVI